MMKKENNKYYTPTIEEFHVGFEYEIMVPEAELWSKETFYLNESHIDMVKYVNIQDEYTKNKIRVKYLDEKDVEELGFTLVKSFNGTTFSEYRKNDVLIQFSYKYTTVKIIRFKYNLERTFFMGEIKNKSELKVLLIQLEVINPRLQ